MLKGPSWLTAIFAAFAPALIGLAPALPAAWQGPVQTLGITMAGLTGLSMPAPSWVTAAHPLIPHSMVAIASVAVAMLKQFADGASGILKVGAYAACCLLAWAAGLHCPSPVGGDEPSAPVVAPPVAKALLALALGAVLLHPRPAMAQMGSTMHFVGTPPAKDIPAPPAPQASPSFWSGLDWAVGPTIPFMEVDFGNPHPLSIAPGAGVQVSLTHDALKMELFGKAWDMLDLDLMAFGSEVNSAQGQFGTFSGAAALCTMSALVCAGAGKHIVAPDGAFQSGGWFGVLALSFNFALAPHAPPAGVENGPPGLVRANTLYFGHQ